MNLEKDQNPPANQPDTTDGLPILSFNRHPRTWRKNHYVYPVISRRSGGLSIGVNLNPDKACNFDCIYCQVDRTTPPTVRIVELDILENELSEMLQLAKSGDLFSEPDFCQVASHLRRINDIAFSGDGEPTTCPIFADCVESAARIKKKNDLDDVKIVLITDACYLTKPNVVKGLQIMDANNGEIWAKLDAGTESYYQQVNIPNLPLKHVINNIIAASQNRHIRIQSMWHRIDERPPDDAEINAFADKLNDVVAAGGRIASVQIYTVARPPAANNVSPLTDTEVDHISRLVASRTSLPVERYYAG
jgi:wyosine [tRNA(Phe)-imidazoG37] synthetase (radical SAM superfamily)